ncbi:MAG TPA: transposase family protein [Oscillatoriales cyanobacterium M59_W2019_021]|nr:transposase family protein [Oscillatoriales cyanobacterium M4454_W2019_049]HIK51713.1 transposase family protein [Oscillatoriales cyanobacterium M59_W2019_021]
MSSIEDYLERYPQQSQTFIGIKFEQFQELVQKVEILHQPKQLARPRLIRVEGGRDRKLSVKQEVLLTLVYLHQSLTFRLLGMQFEVSESTARDIFNDWVETLGEILPASLMEKITKKDREQEWIEEALTELESIVEKSKQHRGGLLARWIDRRQFHGETTPYP